MDTRSARARRFIVAATLVFAAIFGFSAAGAASPSHGSAAQASVLLQPDPTAYCSVDPPLSFQAVDGWKVQFNQLLGTPRENNWKCQDWVSLSSFPGITDDGDDEEFTFPPFLWNFPIDWNDMCNTQYPGSTAQWIPGPETGIDGAPWGCRPPNGVTYNPAENADGTHDVTSG